MQIDGDTLLKVLSFAFSVGATLFAWSQARNKAGAEALKELEGQIASLRSEIAALATRINKAESELMHMPDKDTVHKIQLGMKDVQSQVAAQAETLRGYAEALQRNTETMRRLEDFLMTPRSQPAARRK